MSLLQAEPANCFSSTFVLKLDGRPVGKFEGRFMSEGLSDKEIAWRLQISESYVKAILQGLFQKTGVRTRGQLVRVAFEQYEDQL